jgi:hypothetical protein
MVQMWRMKKSLGQLLRNISFLNCHHLLVRTMNASLQIRMGRVCHWVGKLALSLTVVSFKRIGGGGTVKL